MNQPTLSAGHEFGQQEPLLNRLRSLLRDYPEGLGILKELLQNADDAQARELRIVVDWRAHPIDNLPDPRMAALLGPALLVYNDACFSPQDFDNIQKLGQSGKQMDIAKTGRFGLGFNSVYHVTEWPGIVSGDRIVFLDPQCSAIPGASPAWPGRAWPLAEWWEKYPDFMAVYQAGGLEKTESFTGTLFRLPLRTPAQAETSALRNTPFTRTNLQELLDSFIAKGEEMLLFLKSVEEITIDEITEDGTRCSLLRITTQNPAPVRSCRQRIAAAVSGSQEHLARAWQQGDLPWESWQHDFQVESPSGSYSPSWHIVSGLAVNDRLLALMKQMYANKDKVVPWAGAAARIDAPAPTGHIYCFLPLPLKTSHPVHLHGYFDLDSSRHSLTVPGSDTGQDALRAQWNQELAAIIARAWGDLILALKAYPLGERWYAYWPVTDHVGSEALKKLPGLVLRHLENQPVMPSHAPDGWSTPSQIILLTDHQLAEPLSLENYPLPLIPVPQPVQAAFSQFAQALETLTPAHIRKWFYYPRSLGCPVEEAPRAALRRPEWIRSLLAFYLSEPGQSLKGLPLALLRNGDLDVFGYSQAGYLYLTADPILAELFAGCEDWFLDDSLLDIPTLQPNQDIHLFRMDAAHVLQRLGELMSATAEVCREWLPQGKGIPNSQWLTQLYRYLAQQTQDAVKAAANQALPIVPGSDGWLYRPGLPQTPFWCHGAAHALQQSLKETGCVLVQAEGELEQTIGQFMALHPHQTLIPPLTAPRVLERLAITGLGSGGESIFSPLRHFFSEERWVEQYSEREWDLIGNLPLFPTTHGIYVSLLTDGLALPGSYAPPSLGLSLQLLQPGPWLSLAEEFGIQPLSLATLISQFILPEYAQLSQEQQIIALGWLRDNLEAARTELGDEETALREKIGRTPLIYDDQGRLSPLTALYDPEKPEVGNLLGPIARYPDRRVYATGWERWLGFFRYLGLKTSPDPDDLMACLEQSSMAADQAGGVTAAIEASCIAVYRYLVEHEEMLTQSLSEYDMTLTEFLQETAWLPAVQDPQELDKYYLAMQPENRLYRPGEIYFASYAHRLASQAPLLKVPRQPSADAQEKIGFKVPSLGLVRSHFETILNEWGDRGPDTRLTRALQEIYRTIADALANVRQFSQELEFIRSMMANTPSLWDERTQRFWLPAHAFTEEVPFFGSRRVCLPPPPPLVALFRWAGQKSQPEPRDFVDFLLELAFSYRQAPLPAEEVRHVLVVYEHLDHFRKLNQLDQDLLQFPLLAEDHTLKQAAHLLIPDAEWWQEAIDRSVIQLLHARVPHELAVAAGCRSLWQEARQEQCGEITVLEDKEALATCLEWQQRLNTPEFALALQRLIWHEQSDMNHLLDLGWLKRLTVSPTEDIKVNLRIDIGKKSLLIAQGLTGNHFVSPDGTGIYLRRTGKSIMRHYLLQALKQEVDKQAIHLGMHLGVLLEEDNPPSQFQELLDELQIRTLPESLLQKETYRFTPPPLPEEPDETPSGGQEETPGHTTYPGDPIGRTPARPIDKQTLQAQYPDAAIEPWAPTANPRGKKAKPEHKKVLAGKAYLLARSFEDGLMWIEKAEALFTPADPSQEKAFSAYPIWLMDEPDAASPLRCQVDLKKKLLFPCQEDQPRMLAFLERNGLIPGCELQLGQLENGGYKLDYEAVPSSIQELPVICLNPGQGPSVTMLQEPFQVLSGPGAGGPRARSPSVTMLQEPFQVPCPFDRRLLLSQQRFADEEARQALAAMALTADDIVQTLRQLLLHQDEPINLESLYLLNFQIRPVSYSYFEQYISKNSQDGGMFQVENGKISLREHVTKIHAPFWQNPRQTREPGWPDLQNQLQQALQARGIGQELQDIILETVNHWIKRHP